jgi:hypothetical protein
MDRHRVRVFGAAFRPAIGTEPVAVGDDEHPAMADEAVIARRHAELRRHFGFIGIRHREIMIAEYELPWMAQPSGNGQQGVVALHILVDEVAEVNDER